MKPRFFKSIVACPVILTAFTQFAPADNYTWSNGDSNLAWNDSSNNWDDGANYVPWVDGNTAVFGSTGVGAITVSGTRSIGGLTTSAIGYTLSGGTIALGSASTPFVINNLITINSAITGGTNGIVKTGAGTLILGGGTSNNFTGGIAVNAGRLTNANGASLKNVGGTITVASGATFNAQANFDGNAVPTAISLSGNGSGYDGHGALNVATNVTVSGAIALNSNCKITHDWNAGSISGTITGTDTNIQFANLSSGQPGMSVTGKVTLGAGSVLIQGVAGTNPVSLSGNNSYTGGTSISTGGVSIGHSNALGSGLVTFLASTVLRCSANVTHANPVLINSGINATMNASNGTTFTQSGALTGGGTLAIGASGSTGTVAFSGGLANTYSGPFTVNYGRLACLGGAAMKNMTGAVTVASGATFDVQGAFDGNNVTNAITLNGNGSGLNNHGALNVQGNANLTGTITLNSDAKITHDWNNGAIAGAISGSDKNLQLTTLESGQFSLALSGPVTLGNGGITVNSAGGTAPIVLSGALSYTGETKVQTGTLRLTGTARLDDTSTVRISSGAVLDLNFSGTDTVAALYLNGSPAAAGTYGSLTSTADHKSEDFAGSGILSVGGGSTYSSWAATNAGGQAANLDYDGDGVSNGIEYFTGQTGSGFTAQPELVGNTITWPKDPVAAAAYVVQTSTNLKDEVVSGDGGWAAATSGVVDQGTSVVYTMPSGDPKRFVRLKVVVAP